MNFILQWIDVIWLPLGFLVADRKQRGLVVATVLGCMVMMRLLAELMDSIGHPNGILGLISLPVLLRGQMVYAFFLSAYLLYVIFFKSKGSLLMAGSISIFFATFFSFALVMVL